MSPFRILFLIFCRGAAFAAAWYLSHRMLGLLPERLVDPSNANDVAVTAITTFALCSLVFGLADGLTRYDGDRIVWWALGLLSFIAFEWFRLELVGEEVTFDAIVGCSR